VVAPAAVTLPRVSRGRIGIRADRAGKPRPYGVGVAAVGVAARGVGVASRGVGVAGAGVAVTTRGVPGTMTGVCVGAGGVAVTTIGVWVSVSTVGVWVTTTTRGVGVFVGVRVTVGQMVPAGVGVAGWQAARPPASTPIRIIKLHWRIIHLSR